MLRKPKFLPFKIGGPVTTALYKNWIQKFLDFVALTNTLELIFELASLFKKKKKKKLMILPMILLNFTDGWVSFQNMIDMKNLPNIISEWGYDSEKIVCRYWSKWEPLTQWPSLRNLLMPELRWHFYLKLRWPPGVFKYFF